MGKVLRILVVIILVLGIVAVVLAAINYNKREVLIGRTHLLEETFVKLARTLEAVDAPEVAQPLYPQRDLSPVTSREVENPERSAFWDSYNHLLEPTAQAIPTLDFSSTAKRQQLRQYFKINPATGKFEVDPLTGTPATKGEGTMEELLSEAFNRAIEQYKLLNETRAELPKLRDELINTIEEVNRLKQNGRADKRTIEEKEAQIANLQRELRDRENQIARLNEEIREIRVELQEANDTVAKQTEDIDVLEDRVKQLTQALKDATATRGPILPTTTAAPADNMAGSFTPGVKGKIVSFNEEWKFAVVEFSDEFMDELLGPDRANPMPQIEVMVKRSGYQGSSGEFITRLRLRQVIRQQNLIVADILMDWQQAPVALEDEVYF